MPDSIRTQILRRLVRYRCIGGKHTDMDNLRKGFPRSRYGEVSEEISRLVREGFLVLKPTSYGMHVSLNQNMLEEIGKLIGETSA